MPSLSASSCCVSPARFRPSRMIMEVRVGLDICFTSIQS
nr:MAG TPA: hypothetical protein [Caudoviricetes sp.]